jgi:hypothetical protein
MLLTSEPVNNNAPLASKLITTKLIIVPLLRAICANRSFKNNVAIMFKKKSGTRKLRFWRKLRILDAEIQDVQT